MKTGGGSAGHNGLRSIAAHIGPDFVRVRLGIGHPGDKRLVTNYVLGDFGRGRRRAGVGSDLMKGVAAGAPKLAERDAAGSSPTSDATLPQRPEKPARPKPAPKIGPGGGPLPPTRRPRRTGAVRSNGWWIGFAKEREADFTREIVGSALIAKRFYLQ